jgi:hypothetical protein
MSSTVLAGNSITVTDEGTGIITRSVQRPLSVKA